MVYSNVYEHSARLHQAEHVTGDELGCCIARDEYRANDYIHIGQFLADVMFRRIQRVNVGR